MGQVIRAARRDDPPQSTEDMRRYVGITVRIYLDWDDPLGLIVGKLIWVTEDGEVAYQRPDGKIWKAWPCLAVEALL